MDSTTPYERRLRDAPREWKVPLIEVMDTAEMVMLGLRDGTFSIENPAVECPELVAELTRMTIELNQTFGERLTDE